MLSASRVVFVMMIGLAAMAHAELNIQNVLPFTPEADGVRIVVQVTGNAGPRPIRVVGEIKPDGNDSELAWGDDLGVIPANSTGPQTIEKTLTKLPVKPWSPGSPKLYRLDVRLVDGTKAIAWKSFRFGFRKIESRNGHVILNNKPIFLRGLAINPPGRGVPDDVGESRKFAYDYVRYLRRQNVNLIRLPTDSQDWFDACDELGMMVYQGFYGSPPSGLTREELTKLQDQDEATGKRLPQNFDASMAAYQAQFETYVRHPSIVIYILTNEMPYKGKTGAAVHDFLTRAYDHLSKWDHTRLYIGNAGYGEGKEGDINDVHRYWGWYYNTFLTYYNLRDPKLFGDPDKVQPFTFSECVGNFTGPSGGYNIIERKQLGAALNWSGTAADQVKEAQSYQAFMTKQACESFRRMRAVNPRISGLMPFTITFHNWRGIQSFDEMKPTAAAKQFGISYQPVLLSFEHWQPNVYAGKKTTVFAHVVNDADDFSDLSDAKLVWELEGTDAKGEVAIPAVGYYGTWRTAIELTAPDKTGQHKLIGKIIKDGKTIATNDTPVFIDDWKHAESPGRRVVEADQLEKLDPSGDLLVIREGKWSAQLTEKKRSIINFVRNGGRVLCLGQDFKTFDTSWLPAKLEMCTTSLNDPEYGGTMKRPTYDGMHANIQRPVHPVFKGVAREQMKLWSDATGWDQTKDGFPDCYPINYGFRLSRQSDLENVAILADYDQGLSGVALCEMFMGKGSVMLCGLGFEKRKGVDPVADRMLANLVDYMKSSDPHEKHPRVTEPIRWGDYATHQGTISGPINGFWINTVWLTPPTEPDAKPISKSQGAWNTRPGDQFVPRGIRPRGQFTYTFNNAPRDADDSPTASGIFFATIPAGRNSVVTKVQNPTSAPARLQVDVSDSEGTPTEIPAGETIEIKSPIPRGVTDVAVRYTGERELVILETAFK